MMQRNGQPQPKMDPETMATLQLIFNLIAKCPRGCDGLIFQALPQPKPHPLHAKPIIASNASAYCYKCMLYWEVTPAGKIVNLVKGLTVNCELQDGKVVMTPSESAK